MPLVLIFIGVTIIMVAFNNNQGALVSQIGSDINGGYLKWFGAVLLVGVLGFIKPMQGFSRGVIGLILLAIFLTDAPTALTNAESVFNGTVTPQADNPESTTESPLSSGSSSGSGAGNIVSQILGLFG